MAGHPRTIVVGYDGSETARRALDAAADLVGYGSTISVVSVQNGEVDRAASDDARAVLQRRHVEARYHEPAGEPAERLVETAAELGADIVVVGRRNGNGRSAMLGSVSSRVVLQAPCDMLVVR